MKSFKLLFNIFIVAVVLSFQNVSAAVNPYKKMTSWGEVNCTWSAWQQTYDRTGIALPGFGNAKNWYNDAKNAGFTVGSEPKEKSIIVLDNYKDYGHVAYVDAVNDGKVYVWDSVKCYREMTEEEHNKWWDCIINNTTSADDEYKCDYLKVIEETTCEYSKENGLLDKVVGYIYVTEPRKTNSNQNSNKPINNSNSGNKNNTNKNDNKVEVKSNNNYLKELKIENIEFDFNKDILEYNLEVEYEVERIKMLAVPEDEKTTIVMDDEFNLEVGNNTFKVIVTAEDKSTREYVININRLEKVETVVEEKDTFNKLDKPEEKKFSKNIIVWGVIGGIIVIGIFTSILFIVRKKRK